MQNLLVELDGQILKMKIGYTPHSTPCVSSALTLFQICGAGSE